MQQRERNNLSSSPWLSSGSENVNSMKSRKGQIGQSKKDFDSNTLEYIKIGME